jgi:hypothetical protein
VVVAAVATGLLAIRATPAVAAARPSFALDTRRDVNDDVEACEARGPTGDFDTVEPSATFDTRDIAELDALDAADLKPCAVAAAESAPALTGVIVRSTKS